MNSRQLFIEEAIQLKLSFFDFFLVEDNVHNPYIEGRLHLPDVEGEFIDSYDIKIEVKDGYPNRFPFVYETAQRIPINIDWHVYPDGHCCLVTPPEEILICKKGITLEKFITNYVIPYFNNQLYRESEGYFLNERSHGKKGIIEFFMDYFKTKDTQEILNIISLKLKGSEPKRTDACFCGSKKEYSKCHQLHFRELSTLPRENLIEYCKFIDPEFTWDN